MELEAGVFFGTITFSTLSSAWETFYSELSLGEIM